jgi:threonine efflux protein
MKSTLLTVFIFHWAVLVTPGANVVLVSTLAAGRSRREAMFAALGITFVAGIWASLAAVGVSAVFTALPQVRLALQTAGGLYLLYLAVRLWRSSVVDQPSSSSPLGDVGAFRLGLATNLMNPKSALFFGGLFASVLPASPSFGLVAAVVTMIVANALAWHMLLAVALSREPIRLAYAAKRAVLTRVAALAMGLFGARILSATAGELFNGSH